MRVGPGNIVDFSNQEIKTNGSAVLGTIRTGVPYILNLNEIQSGVTSGNTTFRGILTNPTINFTGTYSGDFVGYDYQPTVTSIANGRHIAMRVASGDILFNTFSGNTGIGTSTPQARLDVRAQGTLSTDIAFRVRNSADNANIMEVAGNNNITILSTAGKAIFSSSGNGANLSMRRDFSSEEMIKINAGDFPFIEVKPINTTSHIAVGTLANGASTWWDGVNYNFQIKNSFHNLFHVVGNPNSATSTFRIGTIASNTNFFNVHGRNAGGTGLSANPVFTINSSGTVGIGTEASTPGARLDVRAQGALSTDIAFRVRNSADSDNLIEIAGNGLIKFRAGTERIELNVSASDYKLSLYKFGVEMTKISTYASYFCYGGSGQYLGIGTNAPSHLLDIYSSVTPILTRWTNDENNLGGSDVTLKFTTRYTGGGSGGNPLAYLTVGGTGAGVNSNNRSYFKFLLSSANTLAERASITSQSNFLLQTPTEDTNDVGVIYVPNGTAPTSGITDGYKQYSADIVGGNAAPHFRTENGSIVKLYQETTGVTTSTLINNAGTTITDTDTFDGYTLQQIVKALRNLGVLQ
jgi:hypothetical protein